MGTLNAPGSEGEAGHGLPPLGIEVGQQECHNLEVHDVGGPPGTAQHQQFPLVSAESDAIDQTIDRNLLILSARRDTSINLLFIALLLLIAIACQLFHHHLTPVPPGHTATIAGIGVRVRIRQGSAVEAKVLITLRRCRRHPLL